MARGYDGVAVLGALSGLAVAAVAAFVLPTSTGDLPRATSSDASAFLAAWERSRTGTFTVESTFTRTMADGRSLTADQRLAQRPPDRLVIGLGTASGRLDGSVIRCASEPSGTSSCFDGGGSGSYEEDVEAELDRLRDYVEGERPLYRVAADGPHCFALDLALDVPLPPYGSEARFCFDPATGAPTVVEVHRPEGTDVTRAVSVSPRVTDADLTLPDPAALAESQAVDG